MKRRITTNALLCACLALTLFTNSSVADIYAPAGLSPGDTFHWVFITSTTRDATSIHIHEYIDFVNAAAAASTQVVHGVLNMSSLSDIANQWKAIAATSCELHVGDNIIHPTQPIYRLDGILIADDEADMFDGTIAAQLNVTENLTTTTATSVWTGFGRPGAGPGNPLGSLLSGGVFYGDPRATDYGWHDAGASPKSNLYPLYAISRELTVVPLPSSIILGLTGLMSSSLVIYRKRKQKLTGETTL